MKKTLYITLFFILIAIIYLTVFDDSSSSEDNVSSDAAERQRLPWHIQLLDDRTTRVFGITLGDTSFKQAEMILGTVREIGIIINQDDQPRLEMFYSSFKSGPITGKLIVTADTDKNTLLQLVQKLGIGEHLKTGARKFIPQAEDLESVYNVPVKQLIFLPSVNLDEDIISKRFGISSNIIRIDEQTTYYTYPEKGLVIALYSKSKDAIHYLRPNDIELFIEGLMQEKTAIETTPEPDMIQ